MKAGPRAWAAAAALYGAACHVGPFYDVHHLRRGPAPAALSAGAAAVAPGVPASAVLEALGPPQRVARHGDVTLWTWRRQTIESDRFGFGIGVLGFNLQFFDHLTTLAPEYRVTALLRGDRLIGIGTSLNVP